MSYARFGDHSDVYVYGDGEHLICCGCKRSEGTTTPAPFSQKLLFYGARWGYNISQVLVESIHVVTFGFLHSSQKISNILSKPSRWYLCSKFCGADSFTRDVAVKTPEEMIAHLTETHIKNGDKVPQYCLDALLVDTKLDEVTLSALNLLGNVELKSAFVAEEGNQLMAAYRKLADFFKEHGDEVQSDIRCRISASLSQVWGVLNNEE